MWNPYSALGMPLAFNWQSGAFGIPALVGYLLPLRLAFTAEVFVTLVIGGVGVYVLGRVLGLGVAGCSMAGTIFLLNGYFFVWLGWPVASVMSWAGWLFAAGILVMRGRRKFRSVTFFAVVLALAIYAGQPDALGVLLEGFFVFAAALLVVRARRLGSPRSVLEPAWRLGLATLGGAALGAPLLLPGLQLAGQGIRAARNSAGTQTLHSLAVAFFYGFDGTPVRGSRWPAAYNDYVSAYLGVIAVVLAVVAIARRRRKPEVLAFGVLAVVAALIGFTPLGVAVLSNLPWGVRWGRNTIVFAFTISMLAGVGLDTVRRSFDQRQVIRWFAGCLAATGVILAAIWLIGRGSLPSFEASARERSFIWPAIQLGVGAAVVGVL
ncbi:MAG: hypothetical protein ACRD6W_15455, partial [Nitrososphaerales archaeon]